MLSIVLPTVTKKDGGLDAFTLASWEPPLARFFRMCYDGRGIPPYARCPLGMICLKTTFLIVGLLGAALSLTLASPVKADTASVRRTIQTELNSMDAAFARRDAAKTFAFYAPDYHRTDVTGKVFDLASDRQGIIHLFPTMRAVHGVNQVQSITVAGARATVSVATRGHIVLQPQGSKTTLIADDIELRSQIWVAKDGTWYLQQSRTVSSRETVHNGGKTYVIVNGKQQ